MAFLTYSEHAERVASEKIVLAWIGAAQRLMAWTVYSGAVYSKSSPEFITKLRQDGVELTLKSNLVSVTSPGDWYFDAGSKIVYVYAVGGVNPDTVFIRADYRIFLANAPCELPWDLEDGHEVEYLPIIQGNSDFSYEIDPDQFGVSLEGQGSITLENNDGYFDARFERYWWENKDVTIWSWSPDIRLEDRQKIYRGYLSGKAFSPSGVTFGLKDFVSKLGNPLDTGFFEESDGTFPDELLGTPKRRLYGRVAGHRLVGLDNVLDGYALTGTLTALSGESAITGSGTAFLDELSPGDTISFAGSTYSIKEVGGDTAITISSKLEENLVSATVTVKPKRPWRKKNRLWQIAGHAIKRITTEVTAVDSPNRIRVASNTDFNADDMIFVGTERAFIRRISGTLFVLEQNLSVAPTIGAEVYRYPVQSVNLGTTDFTVIRDYTVTNVVGNSELVLSNLAEFNVARPAAVAGSVSFVNGSRSVTGSGTQFLSEFQPRDWVRTADGTWYEILSVSDDFEMSLRVPFGQPSVTSVAERKNVTVLDDRSILTVDCFGKTKNGEPDGEWIKTGPEAVLDLVIDAGLSEDADEQSFQFASEESESVISLKLPLSFTSQESPTFKECIDIINQTVMGSLTFNTVFEVEYNVLNSKKPPSLLPIHDDDIISWEVLSDTSRVVREFVCRYRHTDADRYTGLAGNFYQSRVNELADKLSDATSIATLDTYLYESFDAQLFAQRNALYRESSSSRILLSTKLNLSTKQIADKVYVDLDRLFYRLGSLASRRKIGMVVKIVKSGASTVLEIEDLSGIWNKVCSIAPNGASEHVDASEDERVRNGYLTDSNGIIDAKDWTYRTNLIG